MACRSMVWPVFVVRVAMSFLLALCATTALCKWWEEENGRAVVGFAVTFQKFEVDLAPTSGLRELTSLNAFINRQLTVSMSGR